MRKKYQTVNYIDLAANKVAENHRIGDDIFLLDEFCVVPIEEYEFVSIGNTFIEVIEGEGIFEVDGKQFQVKGHSLIFYLQNKKIKTSITGSMTVQRAAVFSDKFLEMLYRDAPHINEIRYAILKNPVVPIDDEVKKSLDIYVHSLKKIASRPHYKIICAEYVTLAFFYGPLQNILPTKMSNEVCRSTIVSTQFFTLLKENFKKEHELAFYANGLKVSRQYLHISVLSASGKAPGYWIDEYLIKEAKKVLLEPEHKINDVSAILNFAGSKQFGRFFKKQTGLTPREYRKLHDQSAE